MEPMSCLFIALSVVVADCRVSPASWFLLACATRASYDEQELQSRLDEFNQRGETIDLEKIELSLPFTERIIYPIARKLGEFAVRFTPQNALQSIARKLELAGNPGKLDPTMFLSLQFIVALLFGGLLILVFLAWQIDISRWASGCCSSSAVL